MRIRDLYVLRASQIRNAKPGKLSDGGGLILLTKPSGRQYWQFRHKSGGKDRYISLGSTEILTLAAAREKAGTCREALMQGLDPKEALVAEKLENDSGPTFKDVALEYIEINKAKWGAESLRQWKGTLRDYAYPYIGHLPIKDIEVEDIFQLLLAERLWFEKNVTATRVRGRIAKVMGFARTRRLRLGSNPASWGDNLENLLPAPSAVHTVKHHDAMPREELPSFIEKLEAAHRSKRNPIGAQCLYWLILSATRYSEASAATFDEIQGDRWVIPAARMKTRQEHIVPLTEPMLALLRMAERNRVCDYLFPSVQRETVGFQPLSENTMTKYLQEHSQANYTVHGFRSTFKDWAMECTNYEDMLSEVALSHNVGTAVRRAYARGTMIEKRRELMEQWAAFATGRTRGTVMKIVKAG